MCRYVQPTCICAGTCNRHVYVQVRATNMCMCRYVQPTKTLTDDTQQYSINIVKSGDNQDWPTERPSVSQTVSNCSLLRSTSTFLSSHAVLQCGPAVCPCTVAHVTDASFTANLDPPSRLPNLHCLSDLVCLVMIVNGISEFLSLSIAKLQLELCTAHALSVKCLFI